jgi:hypothetical protein
MEWMAGVKGLSVTEYGPAGKAAEWIGLFPHDLNLSILRILIAKANLEQLLRILSYTGRSGFAVGKKPRCRRGWRWNG